MFITGWSASNSVPYMRTLWARSKSDIFFGNHGSSNSEKSVNEKKIYIFFICEKKQRENNIQIQNKLSVN